MNIDFASVGGTAVTVAGATIFACELHCSTKQEAQSDHT